MLTAALAGRANAVDRKNVNLLLKAFKQPQTGVYTSQLHAAVMAWQKANKLRVHGAVDSLTWIALHKTGKL